MILDEIEATVSWFKKNLNSPDLVTKIRKGEELALNSYYLATLVADAAEEANNLEYMYKSSILSFQATHEGGVSKGEILAKTRYQELNKQWVEADNLYKRYSLLLHATENIINQIRQSNSFLKNEQRNSGSQV